MKILIAPDKFKGSLSAKKVASGIKKGIENIAPEAKVFICPMADGGEGTVEALVDATAGEIIQVCVKGPLGEPVNSYFGILGNQLKEKIAVIEMAAASGLHLLSEKQRNPMLTTTYGTGELIEAALDKGCKKIIVGIGGSATTDGGMGMARALGVKFFDAEGKELEVGCGLLLKEIAKIDLSFMDNRIKETKFIVASDVDNPLCGPKGAAYVYGPQKGATPAMVTELNEGLSHYVEIIKRDLGIDIKDVPGAGAAGGLGAGLMAFLGAELRSGVEFVIEVVNLKKRMKGMTLVITGEGKIDSQTACGKTPVGVSELAQSMGIPTIAVAGQVGEGAEILKEHGIEKIYSLMDIAGSVEEAMERAEELLEKLGEKVAKDYFK
ncbi:glycerate kinase [Candidatus Oleimmundimicrobium sp.]|uniref:glycerate kinase n=1 Tax=Candidatus Oleimmundimicrobium sp. TaxID=3060597 RepID=UPI0027156F8E|nr:glycerate kinase [Candidatus Oleimmundimicrobium sp.]MDO8886936.1 glycerate kinase [Candidatus Oleimmundimicrobium sp.]